MKHTLLHNQLLQQSGAGSLSSPAGELRQPANRPEWEGPLTYLLAINSLQGAPTNWSLAARFQQCHPDVVNTTTNSGYQFAKSAWFDLQPEQTALMVASGRGWYSGKHADPIVADNTDTFSAASPLMVSRTITPPTGMRTSVLFTPIFADGTNPGVFVSLTVIEGGC